MSDLISRQAAIEALIGHFVPQTYTGEHVEHAEALAKKIINNIPSADRPTGEWVEIEHVTNENGFKKWIKIRCPFCGYEPVFENIDDMGFCPKCGARMLRGER